MASDSRHIVVSNECSANEGSTVFQNLEINHQYSKSYRFERLFRQYCKDYLSDDASYYSILRPLLELQIAKMLAGLPQFYSFIRSCNVGAATNSWCLACPKCVFVFLLMYPFVHDDDLERIFGTADLLDRRETLPIVKLLLGLAGPKPLDCVGTIRETKAAMFLAMKRINDDGVRLPLVLSALKRDLHGWPDAEDMASQVLYNWCTEHFLPADEETHLRNASAI